jgi:nucleolin
MSKEDRKRSKKQKKEKQKKRGSDGERIQPVVHHDEIPTMREEDVEGSAERSKVEVRDGPSPAKAVGPTTSPSFSSASNGKKEDESVADEDGTGTKKKQRKRKRKRKAMTENDENDDDNDDKEDDSNDNTVYVEGIPFDATVERVREFFVSNGVADVVELRLPTWQDSGRLRGYGHVRLGSRKSFEQALKLSGAYLDRRYVTIETANAPGSKAAQGQSSYSYTESTDNGQAPNDCRTLFVTNLPYNATEDDISRVFETYGTIAEDGVRIARNSVSRQSKGFAYIDFGTPRDARKVIEVASTRELKVGGRMVRLDYDTGRIKGSFRTDSGRLWTKETKDKKR